ncbi:multi antimicrobial extrusion (MATE) family protein [Pleurotus pulmonarius]
MSHPHSQSTEHEPLLRAIRAASTSSPSDVASTSSSSSTALGPTQLHVSEANALDFKLSWSLFVDAVPVILSYILQNSIQSTSILIVGRLGPEELSIAAFSLMLAFLTGWCVALGGTTALDTLGSQAFTGGSRRTDLSIHFQRCLVLLWTLLIPVCVTWAFMEPLLLRLGQTEALSKGVQQYLRILTIGAPAYVGFETTKKYLQCQGIMGASTMVLVISSPVNLVLNIYLTHYTSLGLWGSPTALSITYWFAFVLLLLVTARSKVHKQNGTWGGIRPRLVLELRSCYTFLKLAIPGILMVGTEWAAFEIVALAAGRLGPTPLAAQSVIMTTDQILNTIPFGIGVATSTRVGNLIGNRSAIDAKRAAHASAFVSVVVGALVMTAMLLTKDVFGYMFSDDERVVALVARVMPLVASFQIADGLAGACGGVLRGQGRQHLGAIFNAVAYYVLALPLGITLAFHSRTHLGLEGLWIGQVVALFIVGVSEYCAVWLWTDWEKEVARGIERNEEENKRRREVLGDDS